MFVLSSDNDQWKNRFRSMKNSLSLNVDGTFDTDSWYKRALNVQNFNFTWDDNCHPRHFHLDIVTVNGDVSFFLVCRLQLVKIFHNAVAVECTGL